MLRRRGHPVHAGYVSPASDAYDKPWLAAAGHRVAMARAALGDAPWVRVHAWEAAQPRVVRTWEVVERVAQQHQHAGGGRAAVYLVCGEDLLAAMADRARWPDHSLRRLAAAAEALLWVAREADARADALRGRRRVAELGGRVERVHGFSWAISSSVVR